MGLLGENQFPPMLNTHLSIKRHYALQQCFGAIAQNKPSLIYICPTKGVNINILPLLIINKMKFVLVIPSKKFFTLLNKDEKAILDAASSCAEKIVILETKTSNPLDWNKDLIAGTKRVIERSFCRPVSTVRRRPYSGFGSWLWSGRVISRKSSPYILWKAKRLSFHSSLIAPSP